MRILFVIPSITNYFTFLEDIAASMQELGHEVHVASSSKHISDIDCYERDIHGTLHEVDFPRGFEYRQHRKSALQLRAIVENTEPDIINVHFSAGMFTTAMAKQPEWPKTIAMIHGLSFPILTGWRKVAIGAAERWAAKRMDEIILLNEVDRIALQGTVDPDRIKVLDCYGLGCDLDKFDLDSIPSETQVRFHRRLNVREDDFVFIFVGRQVHFKGFDKLIKAFLELYGSYKNMKLLLIGAKDSIHSTNLTPQEEEEMRICPGIIEVGWKDNVQEYLSVAHVNIFPSKREGMPVNLMESLAMGIPVITTDSRGCNEVVEHDINGLLLEEDSVQHIREQMLELYRDRDKLLRLSEAAKELRERFDRNRFIQAMMQIFEPVKKNGSNHPSQTQPWEERS